MGRSRSSWSASPTGAPGCGPTTKPTSSRSWSRSTCSQTNRAMQDWAAKADADPRGEGAARGSHRRGDAREDPRRARLPEGHLRCRAHRADRHRPPPGRLRGPGCAGEAGRARRWWTCSASSSTTRPPRSAAATAPTSTWSSTTTTSRTRSPAAPSAACRCPGWWSARSPVTPPSTGSSPTGRVDPRLRPLHPHHPTRRLHLTGAAGLGLPVPRL